MRGHNDPDPKWDAVDWSRTNKEIAAELGVSRQRVDQIRRKRGRPRSSGVHNPALMRSIGELADTLTPRLIARRLGVRVGTVYRYLQRAGVKAVDARKAPRRAAWKYDWDSVDWERETNTEIAARFGCSVAVVTKFRKRRGKPRGPDGRTAEYRALRDSETGMPLEAASEPLGATRASREGWSTGRLLSEALMRLR